MSDAFDGYLTLRSHYGEDGRVDSVDVLTSDPRIRANADLLRDVHPQPWWSYDGHLLKVHGRNQTVVYRLAGYDAPRDQYLLEWPD